MTWPTSKVGAWEMFNSSVLDVALGLMICFLAVSLVSGTVFEAVSSLLGLRASTLRSGVEALINDKAIAGLADKLYAHAQISPLGPGQTAPQQSRPSYIPPLAFARALMDIAGPPADPAGTQQSALQQQIYANPQLGQLLTDIVKRGGGDPVQIEHAIATWFDNGMDRVSGVYKRWSQLFSVLFALVIAVGLNVDSLAVARAVWRQPGLVAALKLDPGKQIDATAALDLMDANLPVGWPTGCPLQGARLTDASHPEAGVTCFIDATVYLWRLPGWLITAFAALFGAPFWFDRLSALARLRGSGPSPADKAAGQS